MSDLTTYLVSYAILLSIGLIILRFMARYDYRRRGRLSIITAVLQASIWFMYGGFPIFYLPEDWPTVYDNLLVHILGLAAIIIGLGFLFYAMFWLGLPRSLGRGKKALEQNGFYRKSRNPQVLACALYIIGFTMLWPSWYALGWAILYFVLVQTMIITEEEHLLQVHGEQYADYCQKVPRYLTFPK
jgi:protein-S-isoprenylcysteine O-methyltransferase Ste14